MVDIERLIFDFVKIAEISDQNIQIKDIQVEKLMKPHIPPKELPKERMGVYAFFGVINA